MRSSTYWAPTSHRLAPTWPAIACARALACLLRSPGLTGYLSPGGSEPALDITARSGGELRDGPDTAGVEDPRHWQERQVLARECLRDGQHGVLYPLHVRPVAEQLGVAVFPGESLAKQVKVSFVHLSAARSAPLARIAVTRGPHFPATCTTAKPDHPGGLAACRSPVISQLMHQAQPAAVLRLAPGSGNARPGCRSFIPDSHHDRARGGTGVLDAHGDGAARLAGPAVTDGVGEQLGHEQIDRVGGGMTRAQCCPREVAGLVRGAGHARKLGCDGVTAMLAVAAWDA